MANSAKPAGARPAAPTGPHILIVDDHPLVADMLETYLAGLAEPVRVSKAASMPQALALVRAENDLTLVLLDIRMPDMDGLAGLRHLREQRPALPVAILSGETAPHLVRAAQQSGAVGFIRKSMSAAAVLHVLRLILAGERYFPPDVEPRRENGPTVAPDEAETLSPREREVLGELAAGKSNKEIARALGIELVTVSMHLTNVYRKLKVSSRTQAVRQAVALGLARDTLS